MTPKQLIILLHEHRYLKQVYLETKTVSVAACVIHPREGDDAPTQSKQNYNLDVHKHTEWAFNISDYTRNPHKHLLHQTA